MASHWTCPFCDRDTTIVGTNLATYQNILSIENKHGSKALYVEFIVCPNPKCKEYTITTRLYETEHDFHTGNWSYDKEIDVWRLVPPSKAKVFPSYIPQAILDDYKEACLIQDLSPKASATLSRRCLQGMLRDFWKVSKPRLVDEIKAIKSMVDPLSWDAIDAVRSIGNIGAHMEKDINLIIDVDPNEAALLINLIETLMKDWYINKHEREERLKSIVAAGKRKVAQKKGAPKKSGTKP
jgi:hypothetical protein